MDFTHLLVILSTAVIALGNVLGTQDQIAIDKTTSRLQGNPQLDYLRDASGLEAIVKGAGVSLDDQTKAEIHEGVEETIQIGLGFGANGDAQRPKVSWFFAPPRSGKDWFGIDVPGSRNGDNPDNIYRLIPVNLLYDYTITGKFDPNSIPTDFSISTQGLSEASVSISDLQVDNEGRFTVTASAKDSQSKNHLKLAEKTKEEKKAQKGNELQLDIGPTLIVRDDLGNWNTETPAELHVSVSGVENALPEHTDQNILDTAKFYASVFIAEIGVVLGSFFRSAANVVQAPSSSNVFLRTQLSSFAWFKLNDDEAWVINLRPGPATYWIVPLYTFGFVSFDAWKGTTSFNNKQAKPNPDGSFTLVVSKQDPGVHNWLNTLGHTQGGTYIRWQGLPSDGSGSDKVGAEGSVHKIADLHKVLPEGTAYVNAEERQQLNAQRLAGFQRIHNA